MILEEITYRLSEVGIHNPDKYFQDYLKYEKEILEGIMNIDGIKSTIYLSNNPIVKSWYRFAIVFSDFINIIPLDSKKISVNLPTKFPDPNDERNNIQLNIPKSVLDKIYEFTSKPFFKTSYYNLDNDGIFNVNKSLKPFIERGLTIYRPERAIFEFKKVDKNTSYFTFFHVNPDSPIDKWELIDEPSIQYSIPLIGDTNSDFASTLFDLTIPYLDNIHITELNKILLDEYDLIRDFRIELKKIVRDGLKNKKELLEIKEDILKPRIDRINRKFKNIEKMRFLKNTGVVLSSGLLSLISLATKGTISAVSKIIGMTGSGGIFSNEADRVNDIDNLKNDPLYLLWRLKLKNH